MDGNWPLAFFEFFVVIAFGVVYLVVDRIAKRAAKKYAAPEQAPPPEDQPGSS